MDDTNTNNLLEDSTKLEAGAEAPDNAEAPSTEVKLGDKPAELPSVDAVNKMFGEDILGIETGKAKDSIPDKPDQQQILDKPPVISRDYSGYSEDEKKLLEKMSNQSFDYVTKTIKELRSKVTDYDKVKEKLQAAEQNRTVLPDSYYQNPEGYRFSPEYKTIESYVGTSNAIAQHWKQQAIRIEKGEQWQDLIENEKGEIYVSAQLQDASAVAKADVFQWLSQANQQLGNYQSSLEGLRDRFSEKYTNIKNGLKDAETKFFPTMVGDKYDGKEIVTKAADFIKSGGITEDNPLFTLMSKSVAYNIMLRDAVMQLQAKLDGKQSSLEDAKKAGPNGSSFSGGTGQKSGSTSKQPTVSLEDFDRLFNQ